MSQKRSVVNVKTAALAITLTAASSIVIADGMWSTPAPLGPYGGHFDFGIPPDESISSTPQAEYAMYRQQDQLPIIDASYPVHQREVERELPQFRDDELSRIDSAWRLDSGEELSQSCISVTNHNPLSAADSPFQEVVLDEFESTGVDMEAIALEADNLSMAEEYRGQRWRRETPIYYPAFMPDYALGVRRADAMDPLALIPQMRSPVHYFGFQ